MDRRHFITVVGGALAAAGTPLTQAQQAKPFKVGLLTIKTGPLASPGKQFEDGLAGLLDLRKRTIAGRKIELVVADTAAQPAQALIKARELVERDKVDVLVGPLAAFEAIAIGDYIRNNGVPTIIAAAAEDLTQRKASPWIMRASGSPAQGTYAMADYAAKTLKLKRVVTIADDLAYGHEALGGFLRVFEENGGKVVQRLWAPFNATDYGSYISQIKPGVDAVMAGFAGQNAVRFIRQFAEFGLKDKTRLLATLTMTDESLLRTMGDEAVGILGCGPYTATLPTPANKTMVDAMVRATGNVPGYYVSVGYTSGLVIEQALKDLGGKFETRNDLMRALRGVNVAEDPRGKVSFDHYGNVVADQQIFRVAKGPDGKLRNEIVKTYPAVSQFWSYPPKDFLGQPAYSRDYPPARHLES